MDIVKLGTGDILIIDPCYIKEAKVSLKDEDHRYDALRLVEAIYDGDDGDIPFDFRGKSYCLGVDSGRIWALQAEFPCVVRTDSGFSGYAVQRKED